MEKSPPKADAPLEQKWKILIKNRIYTIHLRIPARMTLLSGWYLLIPAYWQAYHSLALLKADGVARVYWYLF
jgi:hypothetical protein